MSADEKREFPRFDLIFDRGRFHQGTLDPFPRALFCMMQRE